MLRTSNRTTRTNARGEYEFADLAPGTYLVTFEMPTTPRQGPNQERVEVVANAVVQVDGTMFSLPVRSQRVLQAVRRAARASTRRLDRFRGPRV